MQGTHFYITSAMTKYTPTCWKQPFQQLNTTVKFLYIHRGFCSFNIAFATALVLVLNLDQYTFLNNEETSLEMFM